MLQGGDSSIKREKVEQEIDQIVAREVEAGEKCLRAPEQQMASNSSESVASTSDVHVRPEKAGYDELAKDMQEMKITDDNKSDNQEDSIKVFLFRYDHFLLY